MLKGILSLACAFLITVVPSLTTAQTPLGVICIAKKGNIFVRPKCLTGETTGTTANLTQKGLTGDTGATGPIGAPGREVSFTNRGNITILAGSSTSFTESCPSGKKVVGGGCFAQNDDVVMNQSYPVDTSPSGWLCNFVSRIPAQAASTFVFTYAICIDA
jgi:hypothetical protein